DHLDVHGLVLLGLSRKGTRRYRLPLRTATLRSGLGGAIALELKREFPPSTWSPVASSIGTPVDRLSSLPGHARGCSHCACRIHQSPFQGQFQRRHPPAPGPAVSQ